MDNLQDRIWCRLADLLMSSLFIWAGFGKLMNSDAARPSILQAITCRFRTSLVWIVIVIELIGGLMILVGFQTRWVALVLAIFCLVTGFGDPSAGRAMGPMTWSISTRTW